MALFNKEREIAHDYLNHELVQIKEGHYSFYFGNPNSTDEILNFSNYWVNIIITKSHIFVYGHFNADVVVIQYQGKPLEFFLACKSVDYLIGHIICSKYQNSFRMTEEEYFLPLLNILQVFSQKLKQFMLNGKSRFRFKHLER